MGSSPLTRGKPSPHIPRSLAERLIPAHAGKTRCGISSRAQVRAHPRSRGENFQTQVMPRLQAGSSPLTRGKHWSTIWQGISAGLIPAHAGKTRRATKRAVRSRAHPRSRGENLSHTARMNVETGSSPLTRGKPSWHLMLCEAHRLIPAHAGKTAPSTSSPWAGWAHPRSRGENERHRRSHRLYPGSSPLTRGKPDLTMEDATALGLIPAHAGKTRMRTLST